MDPACPVTPWRWSRAVHNSVLGVWRPKEHSIKHCIFEEPESLLNRNRKACEIGRAWEGRSGGREVPNPKIHSEPFKMLPNPWCWPPLCPKHPKCPESPGTRPSIKKSARVTKGPRVVVSPPVTRQRVETILDLAKTSDPLIMGLSDPQTWPLEPFANSWGGKSSDDRLFQLAEQRPTQMTSAVHPAQTCSAPRIAVRLSAMQSNFLTTEPAFDVRSMVPVGFP